jgi:hypothetical protein
MVLAVPFSEVTVSERENGGALQCLPGLASRGSIQVVLLNGGSAKHQ